MRMTATTSALLLTTTILVGCSSDGTTINLPEPDFESSPDETLPDETLPADSLPNNPGASDQTSMPAPGVDPSDGPLTISRFNGSYLFSCAFQDDLQSWFIIEMSIQNDLVTTITTLFTDSECTQSGDISEVQFSFSYPGGTMDTSLGVADFVDITQELATLNGEPANTSADVLFDIILVDENNLYFGLETEEFNGGSAETRHNELDLSQFFARL